MAIQNLKTRILFTVVVFTSVVLFLDWFIFSFLFLKIPNELEWDTSPWYNFLQKKETIRFDKSKKSIIVTGSSVALYSYLPSQVDLDLSQKGISTQSEFFGHVAMSPTDLDYYSREIISKKPDIVLYLINPGDYQMDHFPKSGNSIEDYVEDIRIHAYAQRHPVKYYYPLPFLFDNFKFLKKAEMLPLLTKSILYVNRYRSFVADPIDAYLERHTRSGRSFHNYTGTNINPIQWRKGWTDQKFEVDCIVDKAAEFSESVFIPEKDTELKITHKGTEIFNNNFQDSGWYKINFNIPENLRADTIHLSFSVNKVVSSKVIDNKVYGKEYFYGIRLPQNFCKTNIEENISFTRLDSKDDQVLKEMSDLEYELDYNEKMYKDAEKFADNENKIPLRPEVQRLYHLHNVKIFLKDKGPYRWSEFKYVESAAKKFKEAGIPFVIVNNPENSLELKLYKESEWYKDYLKFYAELSEKYSVHFYDKKEAIPKVQDFIDSHHLTYEGSLKMTPIYSSIIKENIR